MFDLFYQYLIIYRKLSVSGLGTFMITRKPAHLNFELKSFISPTWEIVFTKGDPEPDKLFYNYLSSQLNKEYTETIRSAEEFLFFVKREISVYKKVEWPKIGTLTETVDGELFLNPHNYLFPYFPDASAERIIRENGDRSGFEAYKNFSAEDNSDTIIQPIPAAKKNEWYIDAIILAMLAIAGITYYYLQNGTLR